MGNKKTPSNQRDDRGRPDSPPKSQTLWRYMSFSKFISLLSARAVFFARADTFRDPFEGALGPESERERVIGGLDSFWSRVSANFMSAILGKDFQAIVPEPSSSDSTTTFTFDLELDDSFVDRLRLTAADDPEGFREHMSQYFVTRFREDYQLGFRRQFNATFINCWHASDSESEALWRLYSDDHSAVVAISTKVETLQTAFGDHLVAEVRYTDDYVHQPGDHWSRRFLTKRRAFEHEREVRVLIQNYDAGDRLQAGLEISTDVDALIEEIRISPFAEHWFVEAVGASCKAFGLPRSPSPSSLRVKPFRH